MHAPLQNMPKASCFRHIMSPAGGLLNVKGAQGRPFHSFPAEFDCDYSAIILCFATSSFIAVYLARVLISSVMLAMNSSMAMAPLSSPERVRTATVPASASLSPTTSI